MQIILLDKVVNLGNLGDIVKVKDGYARNFLIPQRMAKRATPAAMAEFEVRRAELEKLAAEKLAAAPVSAMPMPRPRGRYWPRHPAPASHHHPRPSHGSAVPYRMGAPAPGPSAPAGLRHSRTHTPQPLQ